MTTLKEYLEGKCKSAGKKKRKRKKMIGESESALKQYKSLDELNTDAESLKQIDPEVSAKLQDIATIAANKMRAGEAEDEEKAIAAAIKDVNKKEYEPLKEG